jgi:cytochrome P450
MDPTTTQDPLVASDGDGGGPGSEGTAGTGPGGVRDPFRFLMRLALRHDVARYRAGAERAYIVTNPDYIKHVLVEKAWNYSKDTFLNSTFKNGIAEGILVSEGEVWRRQRRLMRPAFHRERLSQLAEGMTGATLRMLERWEGMAGRDEPVDMAEEMHNLTLRITTTSLFGADLLEKMEDAVAAFQEGMALMVASHRPQFGATVRRLQGAVSEIIQERRRHPTDSPDLLALLMDARDEETGQGMSDHQLRDEMMTLILAGHETTGNALTWTWHLLSRNRDAFDRMRAELREVLDDRVPTFEDLPALGYTRRVLEESLRLYPPAWIVGRRALGPDRLGDTDIPAGSVVAMSPYIVHRHPAYWDDPERFDPDRFTREQVAGRKPFAYFPFGGGPRLCIGHNFALIEAQLVLATACRRYDALPVPGHHVEPERLFVLRPRGGLMPLLLRAAA